MPSSLPPKHWPQLAQRRSVCPKPAPRPAASAGLLGTRLCRGRGLDLRKRGKHALSQPRLVLLQPGTAGGGRRPREGWENMLAFSQHLAQAANSCFATKAMQASSLSSKSIHM